MNDHDTNGTADVEVGTSGAEMDELFVTCSPFLV